MGSGRSVGLGLLAVAIVVPAIGGLGVVILALLTAPVVALSLMTWIEAHAPIFKHVERAARGSSNPANYQARVLLTSAARVVA